MYDFGRMFSDQILYPEIGFQVIIYVGMDVCQTECGAYFSINKIKIKLEFFLVT